MTEFEFTGKDLKDRWGVKWFELIDYVRTSNGKLQPYDSYGYRIIDPCTEYGDSVFRELFLLTLAERPDLIESVSQKTPPKHVLHEKNQPEYWSLNLKAHAYYQLIEVVFRAHNCVIGDFTVPADEIKAETLILNAKGWLFKTADVLVFEKRHGLDRWAKHTSTNSEKKVFPCKPGTKWKDVEITLKSDDAVMIKTPEGSRRYHYSELGMKDERKGDTPTMSWELLMYFCKYSGRISSTTSVDRILNLRFRNLSKSISNLNKKLQNISGIPESFCKKYNKRDGWVAKCIFNDNTFSA
jgi:hypothetical protein